MTNFWDDWQKPWTKKQCKQRYVNSDDDISLDELSKVSGVPKGTLERLSAAEKWFDQRKKYRSKLEAKTEEKTIEKISEIVSEHYSQLTKEHLKFSGLVREIATIYFTKILVIARSGESQDFVTKLNPVMLEAWGRLGSRAIADERVSAGLEYEDINKAMRLLERFGYVITEPVSANAKEQSESKAKATKGISDSTAAEIRSKILGVESEDTPTISAEVDS